MTEIVLCGKLVSNASREAYESTDASAASSGVRAEPLLSNLGEKKNSSPALHGFQYRAGQIWREEQSYLITRACIFCACDIHRTYFIQRFGNFFVSFVCKFRLLICPG